MTKLAPTLGLASVDPASWYKVTQKLLIENGGAGLLALYGNSVQKMLTAVFPDFAWDPRKFAKAPQRYWHDVKNQRTFLDELGKRIGASSTDLSPWYKVQNKFLIENGGSRLLSRFGNSMFGMLSAVYPEFAWDPLKFAKAPQKYWKSLANQRKFMEEVRVKIGIPSGEYESWYKVSNRGLIDLGVGPLLNENGGSLVKLLSKVYPEFKWDPLKFSQAPRDHWTSLDNQRSFMDGLGRKLGFKENDLSEWYKASYRMIADNGGGRLLAQYDNSLILLLSALYPDFEWNASMFAKVPQNFWDSVVNQRAFVDDLGTQLGFKVGEREAWYKVSNKAIIENGGGSLLSLHGGSLPSLLSLVYPDYPWLLWKFPRRSQRIRNDSETFDKLLSYLESTLEIKTPEDWYRVKMEQLKALGVVNVLRANKHGGLAEVLQKRYPTVHWAADNFRI